MSNNTEPTPRGALAGVRVIEMGQLVAGPFCGQLLADHGADVVKLEDPGRGDPLRVWGRSLPEGQSLWWSVMGRNKRSVRLDLRTPEGQEIARSLIATADVLVENFRPGTMERWGLGYDDLSAGNPGLIMARVSGFGQDGPYAPRAGYGAIGEAMGGLRYIVGDPDSPPARVGISIGDSLAGTFAALGVLAALEERHHSGLGQVVDAAIYESVLAMTESMVPEWQYAGHQRERSGPILPNVAPSNVYPTRDGLWVLIAANQDTVFARLAEALQRPELAGDPRYATHTARGEHQGELDELIGSLTVGYPAHELERLMEEHGVPAGRIFRVQDMVEDPHFRTRGSLTTVDHPHLGDLTMQNIFPRLSRTSGVVRWPGPDLGQHTDEVLTELGIPEDEQATLREKGVV